MLPPWFFNWKIPSFPLVLQHHGGAHDLKAASLSLSLQICSRCCLCVPLTCWAWYCSQALTNCFSSARAREEAIHSPLWVCWSSERVGSGAVPLSWHRLMCGVVQCTEDQSQLAGNVLTTLRQPCQNVHQSTNALLVTLTQCAFKVICSLTLSQPLISFLSYPYFHCYTAKGALLHIFWNSTEFLDPKTDEEDAETSVRSTVYTRKLTQSSNNELTCVPVSCVSTCSQCFLALIGFFRFIMSVWSQPCFPNYLVFPSVYKSCDSPPLCPVLIVIWRLSVPCAPCSLESPLKGLIIVLLISCMLLAPSRLWHEQHLSPNCLTLVN